VILLKNLIKNAVITTLYLIPVTAIVTGFVIFFSNIMFGQTWNFMQIWRAGYFLTWIVFVGYEALRIFVLFCKFLKISRKIHRPYSKVETAFIEYGLGNFISVDKLTGKYFDIFFETCLILLNLKKKINLKNQ